MLRCPVSNIRFQVNEDFGLCHVLYNYLYREQSELKQFYHILRLGGAQSLYY